MINKIENQLELPNLDDINKDVVKYVNKKLYGINSKIKNTQDASKIKELEEIKKEVTCFLPDHRIIYYMTCAPHRRINFLRKINTKKTEKELTTKILNHISIIYIHHLLKANKIFNPNLHLIQYLSVKINNKFLNKRLLKLMIKKYNYNLNLNDDIKIELPQYAPQLKKAPPFSFNSHTNKQPLKIYDPNIKYTPFFSFAKFYEKIENDTLTNSDIVELFWETCWQQFYTLDCSINRRDLQLEEYTQILNQSKITFLLKKNLEENLSKKINPKTKINKV